MCWVEGGVDGDPYEQVRDVVRAGWGGSTNF